MEDWKERKEKITWKTGISIFDETSFNLEIPSLELFWQNVFEEEVADRMVYICIILSSEKLSGIVEFHKTAWVKQIYHIINNTNSRNI